jgi:hypothetical protein
VEMLEHFEAATLHTVEHVHQAGLAIRHASRMAERVCSLPAS